MRPSSRHDKRKRTAEFDLANPPAINPESVMAVTRGAVREALAEQVGLLRRTEITASQPGVLEGYTPNPELANVVKRLHGYLQPMVTLMRRWSPRLRRENCERRGVGRH